MQSSKARAGHRTVPMQQERSKVGVRHALLSDGFTAFCISVSISDAGYSGDVGQSRTEATRFTFLH